MKQFFMNLCKRINRFIKNNCIIPPPIIINDSIKRVMFDEYGDSILTNEETNKEINKEMNKEMNKEINEETNKEINEDQGLNHILNLPPYMRPKL